MISVNRHIAVLNNVIYIYVFFDAQIVKYFFCFFVSRPSFFLFARLHNGNGCRPRKADRTNSSSFNTARAAYVLVRFSRGGRTADDVLIRSATDPRRRSGWLGAWVVTRPPGSSGNRTGFVVDAFATTRSIVKKIVRVFFLDQGPAARDTANTSRGYVYIMDKRGVATHGIRTKKKI